MMPRLDSPADSVTVPHTVGRVRSIGVGDLMLVRQTLRTYEAGELSHIENMLAGEHFQRVFRRKDTTEAFEEEEIEHTESTERELQTTTRSELKHEVEKTVEEDLRFEAGVNVTYQGPMVEVSANVDFAYERSSQEATRTASSFARDVVDRSASKVSDRVLKRRSLRQQREVEDTATRGVTNDGDEPQVGVYRWVDKIYDCQVVNYGRRQLFEFVVPEPAAYYRYLRTSRPPSGVTATRPDKPMVGARPLEPGDLTDATYGDWVARYQVTGVTPPPPGAIHIGIALEQGQRDDGRDSMSHALSSGSLKVDDGYAAERISFDYAGEYDEADHYWEVVIGTIGFKEGTSRNVDLPHIWTGNIPVSMVTKNWGSFTANIMVQCRRLTEKLAAWQLETYAAIMNRYQRLESEYQGEVEAAKLQSGQGRLQATNPLVAREVERNEIKRASIAMLTGQGFDDFGTLSDGGDGPHRIAFADADAEGRYIQFIEQAFEWRHMAYVFYPYFWGRRTEWPNYALLEDADPLFAQFLRAGAARVVVGVRPGFEDAVDLFLTTGEPWSGGAAPGFDSPGYVSVAQELQEQLGLEFTIGRGMLRIVTGERTATGVDVVFDTSYVDRELRVEGEVYRVVAVGEDGGLGFDRAFTGATGDHRYAVGPRLVGPSWPVRLPTTLVILAGREHLLPTVATA